MAEEKPELTVKNQSLTFKQHVFRILWCVKWPQQSQAELCTHTSMRTSAVMQESMKPLQALTPGCCRRRIHRRSCLGFPASERNQLFWNHRERVLTMKHSIHLLRWSNSSFYNRQKDKRKEFGRLHGTNGELLVADDHGAPADASDSQTQRHDP